MEGLQIAKTIKTNGAVELRVNFGQAKVAIMTKGSGGYFYMNLYDNRQRYKNNKIFFGYDELEEVCGIYQTTKMLHSEFEQVSFMT